MSDLERRVARAMAIDAWTEKGYSETQVAGWWDASKNGSVLNKRHYRKRARAALKAHAEYLAEHNMRVITFRRVERQPFVFDAEDLQQDQSHE